MLHVVRMLQLITVMLIWIWLLFFKMLVLIRLLNQDWVILCTLWNLCLKLLRSVIHVSISVVLSFFCLAILGILWLIILFLYLSILDFLWACNDIICFLSRLGIRWHWHIVDVVFESITHLIIVVRFVVVPLHVLMHMFRKVGTRCQGLASLVPVALDPFTKLFFVVTGRHWLWSVHCNILFKFLFECLLFIFLFRLFPLPSVVQAAIFN